MPHSAVDSLWSSDADRRAAVDPATRLLDPSVQQLISLFEQTFLAEFNTRLVAGEGDPVYLPANEQFPSHRIVFAHGFFSSALHEIAHWCVAGEQRREQLDYGYWYAPDGRTAAQQRQFEQVEVRPQAVEWWLAKASGRRFRVSVDNLGGEPTDPLMFQQSVVNQARRFCRDGLPARAQRFVSVLAAHFAVELPLGEAQFTLDELQRFGDQ